MPADDGRVTVAGGELGAVVLEMRSYAFPWAKTVPAVPYTPRGSGRFAVHKPKLVEWHECDGFDMDAAFAAFLRGVDSHGAGPRSGTRPWIRASKASRPVRRTGGVAGVDLNSGNEIGSETALVRGARWSTGASTRRRRFGRLIDWLLGTPVESLSVKQIGGRPRLVGFAQFGQCRDAFGELRLETGIANAALPAV